MTLYEHAVKELEVMGMIHSEDDMNSAMSENVLELIKVFAGQGHSGFSASYCIDLFSKLASYKPLAPLTGEDDEWVDVAEHNGGLTLYQNKRYSAVFKDDTGAWNIDGKVFWEWYRDEDGEPIKIYYSSKDSSVPVSFPYDIPNKPIYEYRYEFEEGAEPQDETGFL